MERFSFLHDHVLASVLGLTFHLSPFSGQRRTKCRNEKFYSLQCPILHKGQRLIFESLNELIANKKPVGTGAECSQDTAAMQRAAASLNETDVGTWAVFFHFFIGLFEFSVPIIIAALQIWNRSIQ